jgi:hypothetical protein
MAATQQPPTPPPPGATLCANCGTPLAADQRYCLACGTRRGDPRVPAEAATVEQPVPAEPAARPADVSPLAAVIGIALLGGMLLIGVLIGRETGGDETTPAPVVQVGESTSAEATTPTTTPGPDEAATGGGGTAAVVSEWPQGTDGFTIQLSTVPKSEATQESVESAKQGAIDQGATDAAVLDSDLYSSLPPGQFVIYSGVYGDRKSAEVGLKDLGKNFANATVVEVSDGDASAQGDTPPADSGAVTPGAGGEDELSPEVGGTQK